MDSTQQRQSATRRPAITYRIEQGPSGVVLTAYQGGVIAGQVRDTAEGAPIVNALAERLAEIGSRES